MFFRELQNRIGSLPGKFRDCLLVIGARVQIRSRWPICCDLPSTEKPNRKGARHWTRKETYADARAIVEVLAGGYGIGLADAWDMIHPVKSTG